MTLHELAMTLPNGFHDAEVSDFTIDYLRRELRLMMRVWIEMEGTPEDETYRTAMLTLSGLLACVIEPPNCDRTEWALKPAGVAHPIRIDTFALDMMKRPPAFEPPDARAEGAFTDGIYVFDWNSYIFVTAMAASLDWLAAPGPPD